MMVFHADPCALHGMDLVKALAAPVKAIMSALYSLTRWLRVSKNRAQDSSYAIVARSLEVEFAERSGHCRDDGLHLIGLLYGDLESSLH
jgi:hypothetical protein